MFQFDSNKIWYSLLLKKYVKLSPSDINILTSKIQIKLGGFLKRGTPIHLSEIIKCLFDIVVIESHPCVLYNILGQGAYGIVYEAWDIKRNKKVAVKCQESYLSDIIIKQAEVTKNNGIGLLNLNDNIGPSFLSNTKAYFILPLADDCFNKWIFKKASLNQNDLIVKALIKIGKDLLILHKNNKVHMDLKSDNVLIFNDVAYISDFGKTESIGKLIPSINHNYSEYPQCAPEYFSTVSKNPFYQVSDKFDIFSYGNLLKFSSIVVKNATLKKEIFNISTYIHRHDPNSRKSIREIITYLEKLL